MSEPSMMADEALSEAPTAHVSETDASGGIPPQADADGPKIGGFAGVFRPTLLTILGLMLFIREGWLVGNAGILGGMAVLLLTYLITGTTALSISTITTNIRLGAGGAFALVSRSMGLEAGGAIGIPLYLAIAMSSALYIYGLAGGWGHIFPNHPKGLVVFGIYVLGFLASTLDVRTVFRLQGPVLLTLIAALASMWGGYFSAEVHHTPEWIGGFQDGNFWLLFAVFFPAGSGIMVGLSLSGKLADPRRAIPRGILGAWGVGLAVYAVMMVWFGMMASPEALRGNNFISVEKAAIPWLVHLGLVACCSSAVLGSFVAAPQVLFALGRHRLLPKSEFFTATTRRGAYKNAILVTGVLIGLTLLLGDLDRVARLITMFFLITYATLNVVLVVEQSLALISFRPTLRVPTVVPLIGAVACVFAMMITAPTFGIVALVLVTCIYFFLASRKLETPWETVRSGMFIAMADWAAKKTQRLDERFERAWKPDVLVPIRSVAELDGKYRFLRGVAFPKGSLQILAVNKAGAPDERVDERRLAEVVAELQLEDLFVTSSVIEAPSVADGTMMGAAVMQGGFFRPNMLFIDVSLYSEDEAQALLDTARRYEMGAVFLMPHPEAGLGHERRINVWVRDQSPNWAQGLTMANIDLNLLLAYQLSRNWGGELRMLSVVSDPAHIDEADRQLRQLYVDARLPGLELSWVRAGQFEEVVADAPRADLQLFGLGRKVRVAHMREMALMTGASCLFILDSGHESAFA